MLFQIKGERRSNGWLAVTADAFVSICTTFTEERMTGKIIKGIAGFYYVHIKDYGIYEFKRGFNGEVEELIGEYELPISIHYYIMKLIKKIRK